MDQGILCRRTNQGTTFGTQPIREIKSVTIAIASAIFGRRTETGTITTWEELAARANYRATVLASICGVSLRTVQRHFRANYQLSVREWLNSVRLELARRRLNEGGRVKEVAYELGFKQISSFSRAFKERYGIPPSSMYGPELSSVLFAHGTESLSGMRGRLVS